MNGFKRQANNIEQLRGVTKSTLALIGQVDAASPVKTGFYGLRIQAAATSKLLKMAEVQAKLQSLSEEFQKLQQDLQNTVASRQKLEGQRQENLGVQKEFENIGDDETIYKLVGPVLLKQEKFEAESTVKGRLDFIGGEILEGQIKETQENIEKKKTEIIQVQSKAQGAIGGQ
ncbi:prefoldin beta subunit [Trichoderma arundinaceum]|uniref:Prefoldin beta subunit n=1 Tax=Trichoderma arundinaceum TaxID=490622 RepID=A0A395NH25_TRIAR|nr:prefoldin beta subunit [Trichoderma arundinaceum]